MRILRVALKEFRNYESAVFEPGGAMTVLVGPNGSGKTNLIEAVEIVTSASSFRSPSWGDTVRWGSDAAKIRVEAVGESVHTEVSVEITAEGRRQYRVDRQPQRKIADIVGLVPTVVFTPDDLRLVKGGAERRRGSLDDLGERLWPLYRAERREYGRVIRQRNLLLKEVCASTDLEVWDDQLVTTGARLLAARLALLGRVAAPLAARYAGLAGGALLECDYVDRCGLDPGEWRTAPVVERLEGAIRNELRHRRAEEKARRMTLVGPHRDDVALKIDGRPARLFASQGEQRSVALAWKLAQLVTAADVTRKRPVLLLDDVMSELDEARRAALLEDAATGLQTLITTTDLGYFEAAMLESAEVIRL